MSRVCDLTGKRRLVGHKVSHAKNRTKMTQKPNLHNKRIYDPATGQWTRIRPSAKALRTLDKMGISLTVFRKKYHPPKG